MKIHMKTQRGMGKLKFCMNMYHTKNKIMVNGPDSSLFNKNHDQIVKVILEKSDVQALNQAVYQAIMIQLNNMNITKAKLKNKDSQVKSLMITSHQQLDELTQRVRDENSLDGESNERICVSTESTQQSNECGDEESNSLDYCPHCDQYVGNGIACDSCECWYHYGCEGLDNNGLSNDSESYICRSCKQDHENELTHSLAEIDTCTQRNDETELIQTVSSAEVMNIDTECDKSGSKQPDSSIDIVSRVRAYSAMNVKDPIIETNVNPPVVPEIEHDLSDIMVAGSKASGKTQNSGSKNECKDTGKSNKSSKKGQRKQTPQNEELQENLNLAKSYISKLERKLLELENSNKILRSEMRVHETQHFTDSASNVNNFQNSTHNRFSGESSDNEIDSIRNQMRNIELEHLKTRMTMMEQNLMAQRMHVYQNYPPPGFHTYPNFLPAMNPPYGPQPHAFMVPAIHPSVPPFVNGIQRMAPPAMFFQGPGMYQNHLGVVPLAHHMQGPPLVANNRGGVMPSMMGEPVPLHTPIASNRRPSHSRDSSDTDHSTPTIPAGSNGQNQKIAKESCKATPNNSQKQGDQLHKSLSSDTNSDAGQKECKHVSTGNGQSRNKPSGALMIDLTQENEMNEQVTRDAENEGDISDNKNSSNNDTSSSFLCAGRATEAIWTEQQKRH